MSGSPLHVPGIPPSANSQNFPGSRAGFSLLSIPALHPGLWGAPELVFPFPFFHFSFPFLHFSFPFSFFVSEPGGEQTPTERATAATTAPKAEPAEIQGKNNGIWDQGKRTAGFFFCLSSSGDGLLAGSGAEEAVPVFFPFFNPHPLPPPPKDKKLGEKRKKERERGEKN